MRVSFSSLLLMLLALHAYALRFLSISLDFNITTLLLLFYPSWIDQRLYQRFQTELLPTYESITFSDLRSVGNCHNECIGCSESGSANACFACKHYTQSLRNRAGFKCVANCDDGFYIDNDRCKACSTHCKTCKRAEQCTTCYGIQLLIDVDHFGHFDHGQCVDACPSGLISDYDTNLIQARCVLKKNTCFPGYYEDPRGNCVPCDKACATCHDFSASKCDSCAYDYSNTTWGFCVPCCEVAEKGMICEPCSIFRSANTQSIVSHSLKTPDESLSLTKMYIILAVFLVAFLGSVYGIIQYCNTSNQGMPDERDYPSFRYSQLQTLDDDDDGFDETDEEMYNTPTHR